MRADCLTLIVIFGSLLRGCTLLIDTGLRRSPTRADIARENLVDIETSAYPQWQVQHPGESCPSLAELGAYRRDPSLADPWGNTYDVFCSRSGLVARSVGEDGQASTPDDIWSDR